MSATITAATAAELEAHIARERARELPEFMRERLTGAALHFVAAGAFADMPRMVEYVGDGRRVRLTTAELDAGLASGALVNTTPALECLDGPEGCRGKVEMRWTGVGFRAWPRCEKHGEARLEREARALEYMSDTPPAWFDEADAGERWSDDY